MEFADILNNPVTRVAVGGGLGYLLSRGLLVLNRNVDPTPVLDRQHTIEGRAAVEISHTILVGSGMTFGLITALIPQCLL